MKALSVRLFRACGGLVSPARSLAVVVVSLLALAGVSRAAEAPPGWTASAEQAIAASEYFVSWQDEPVLADLTAAWHAPNRAHDFRIYFTGRGVRVVPRTAASPAWEWGLELVSIGREERLEPVPAARLTPHEGRIDYDRGALLEWYENSPRGLEQGFTIPAGPAGEGPLVLQLALSGTLSPRVSEDGQAIDFAPGEGMPVVHYAQLRVTDARDQELPARFAGSSGDGLRGIRILIDDAGADYPVYVDPLATSPAWIGEANQVQANFGYAVATAGDVNGDGYSDVIVGAPYYDNGQTNEGRAFVFHGSAAGLATTAAWYTESNQVDANFGFAVATAGDMDGDGYSDVIVGAPYYDNGQTDEGRAWVYCGSSSGLSTTARWTGESNQASSYYGRTVGTAGDVQNDGYSDIIVGASNYDNTLSDEGAAFAYYSDGRYFPTSPSWTAYSGQASAIFGFSVATAGDVNGDGCSDVVVGAPLYENGEADEGGVFLFLSVGGKLEAKASWIGQSNQADAHLGESVGTAGDVNGDGYSDIIAGAMWYDNGQSNEGRVFVYHGSAAGSPSAAWTYENDQAGSDLGRSVGTAGDVNGDGYADVIFSAIYFDNGETDEGRAYVVLGSAMGLASWASWMTEPNQTTAVYGRSVGTAGDVNGDGFSDVIVGAQYYDAGQFDEGAAFVYLGGSNGLSGFYATEIFGPPGELGGTLASAGDVNGDGYADLIAGGPSGNEAKAYYGSASGADDVADWSVTSVGAESVASAGDVNGDGYSDVIVGDPYYDSGQNDEGRVRLYYGSSTGLAGSPGWTQESNNVDARYGWSVASAGDVNGDGYADIVVGAPFYNYFGTPSGCIWVYHGSASGPVWDNRWHCSDYSDDEYGTSVASAGDINRDGYSDIIVGAPGDFEDAVRVYLGSASGVRHGMGEIARREYCANPDPRFGEAVASAGDVNGDGYSDVVVGAPLCEGPASEQGKLFVYYGNASGLSENPAWTYSHHLYQYDQIGRSVACAGDVDGDGYADIVAGAPANGWAYVFNGSASGLPSSPTRSYEGRQAGDRFGQGAASAGDLNGDGYADVAIGAPGYDAVSVDAGRIALYYGNGGPGGGAVSLRPRQRRADDLGEIALRGTAEHRYNFRLLLTGRTPFGRGRVKLEWEDKTFRAVFDGASTHVSASWMNTGVSGVTLDELVAGHTQSNGYHWRVRLRYSPATTPFQARSRWMTTPWNGWQEARLRTFTVDADDDGYRDFEDCNESAATAWASPTETRNLRFAADRTTLNWDVPVDPGGSFTFYDTLRTPTASDFVAGTTCVESDDANLTTSDTARPAVGQVWFYLTRADNYCPGEGTLGNRSDTTPRSGRTCP